MKTVHRLADLCVNYVRNYVVCAKSSSQPKHLLCILQKTLSNYNAHLFAEINDRTVWTWWKSEYQCDERRSSITSWCLHSPHIQHTDRAFSIHQNADGVWLVLGAEGAVFLCNWILTAPYRFDRRTAAKRLTRVSLSEIVKWYGNKRKPRLMTMAEYISAELPGFECKSYGVRLRVIINHVDVGCVMV